MRNIVQQVVSQFLAGELPRNESYYQRKNQEVVQLVEELEQFTKRNISWEPPVDMLNFYRLQIPVEIGLNVPLSEITIDDLQDLVYRGKSTTLLQVVISSFSRFAYTYWGRFFPPQLEETISSEATFQDSSEQSLFEQVQQKLE